MRKARDQRANAAQFRLRESLGRADPQRREAAPDARAGAGGRGWELLAKTTKLRRCWRWPRNGEDTLKNGKKGEFYVIYASQ